MMPRPLQMLLYAAAAVPLLAGIFDATARDLGILATVFIFLVSLLDRLLSPSPANIHVERDTNDVMSVGAQNAVTLRLHNCNRSSVHVQVHDEPPEPCTTSDLPFELRLKPNQRRHSVYHVQPHQRGRNRFGSVYLRGHSRLGLWTLSDVRELEFPVRIYPDIQAVHGVELLARQNRLAEAGVRLSRLRGRGNEFERLREYRREDEYRSIDWKATARHQNLISREYVVEKNQTIIFLLDCGRSMCNELDGITHFDRALNAIILLSYVALRQGDTVGVLAFSNKIERWVPPVRGVSAAQKLIRQLYDLQPTYEASDYNLLVEETHRRCRKRALLILVSHALDEVHLKAMGKSARQLKRPHLVINALLQNVPLNERLDGIPQTDLEAFQIAAAAGMVASQSLEIAQLQKQGLLMLDTLPEQLSAKLISQYLDIKARHLL